MPNIVLYNFPQSTCSQKVRLALWEKKISYNDRILDHKKREHLKPNYLTLNPNGVVPTLTDGKNVLTDSSVILEYLEDVYPKVRMSPTEPVEKATMRKWLRYLEEVPTPAIRIPSFNKFLFKRYKEMDDKAYKEMSDNHPVRKHFYKRMDKTGFSEGETKEALDNLELSARRIDVALGKHGENWILGKMLTIVDLAYLPTVDRMLDLGLEHMIFNKKYLRSWYENFSKRDSFKKTFYKGSRLTEIFGSE